jgi:predicted AAA+ superfamily ATPase
MQQIPESEIKKRLAFENPWWDEGHVPQRFRDWPRRAYFNRFWKLFAESTVHRAVILMGPRRVGKTVMLTQAIQHLIDEKVSPNSIFYVSIDAPTYIGLSLEKLLQLFMQMHDHKRNARLYVIWDEIQYLKDWERHLKSLVDSHPSLRIVASGSAAAALRAKSDESGAGRFTDVVLPPLTFAEFVRFKGVESALIVPPSKKDESYRLRDNKMNELNEEFVDYVNFGGFPEVVLNKPVRENFSRFIGSDILDKVLLRDLPSLYGIGDTRELNRLFTSLAYNSGNELSLETLSQTSGVAKNTLRRYLEYLEAAFLTRRVQRIDHNARRFRRAVTFKVYLTNPCMRAALFGPVGDADEAMGRMAETAVYSQFFQSDLSDAVHYARWKEGEVDLVLIDEKRQRPIGAYEVKWTDRIVNRPDELRAFLKFGERAKLKDSDNRVLTRTYHGLARVRDHEVLFVPVSWFCYLIGKLTTEPVIEANLLRQLI